ncbi:MAG: LysR family transcriptional regulator [Bdellovibrio sp.]|nr:LysR family transcriptional regulator [Bdellovibrio sp.]
MITYLNLYHLKYFAQAVELGSISRAAEKNLVTHPAISRAVSSLERHLGVELMEHQKKSFKVTEAGFLVAKQARLLLAAASYFNSSSLTSPSEESITLCIGISKTLSEIYLNTLLKDIKSKFPKAKAQVRFGTTAEIIEAVAKNTIDLGITIGSQNLPTLKQSVIKTEKFMLVESAKAGQDREEIKAKSFILTEPRYETALLRKAYQKQFAQALPVLFEISSWEVIGQLVQQGLGVGLLPDISIKHWNKNSYRILKPAWFSSEYEVYIHHSKASIQNPVRQYVLHALVTKV